MIPYSTQTIEKKDIKSVIKVLSSKFLTQGPKVSEFESKLKLFVKSKHAVASNSATSSLILACLALGIKKNDIVWTSPNSFVSTANCAVHCGAKIDFVDIDKNTFNISIEKLKIKLIKAKKANKLPKLIIPVHFAGNPCDMKEIFKLSKIYKFKILEDASHALGSKYNGHLIGSCKYSDVCVFSFHPVKSITTGEGGMGLTNNKNIFNKMKLYSIHGIEKKKSNTSWLYEQKVLGYNFRMSDIQASLGISQLSRLKQFIKKRSKIAKFYDKRFKKLFYEKQQIQKNSISSYHLYVIKIKKKPYAKERKKLFNILKKKNFGVQVHYIPIYRHPFYKKMGFKIKYFPNNEDYYSRAISLPIFPNLKIKNNERIIKILGDYEKL